MKTASRLQRRIRGGGGIAEELGAPVGDQALDEQGDIENKDEPEAAECSEDGLIDPDSAALHDETAAEELPAEDPVKEPESVPAEAALVAEPEAVPAAEGAQEPAADMVSMEETEPESEPESEPEPVAEAVKAPAPEPAPASALAPQALDAEAEGLAEGIYVIRSMNASRQVLDVTAQSKSAGANVETWDSNGGGNQKWEVRRAADGTYTLKSVLSGLLLDVSGAAAKNGANVIQWQANGGKNQSWSISANASGAFTIASALSKNLVLDVSGASKSSGANVIVWAPNGGANQLWEFVPANPNVAAGESIKEGYYRIASADKASVLDIAGQSVSAGGNVELWTANGGANQVFYVSNENGYVRIQNGATGLFVSTTGADPIAGSNVSQQWRKNDSSQLFSAEKKSDGSYAFRCAANGLYLNAPSTKSGANIASAKGATSLVLTPLTSMITEGIVTIAPNHAASMMLGVAGDSTSAGANVCQQSASRSLAQRWEMVSVPNKANTYTIQSVNSGLYLSDTSGNADQRAGTADAAHQWAAVPMGNGFSFKNAATGKLLDISGQATGSGANACTWERNGGTNQRFTVTHTAPVANGAYYVRLAAAPSVVVEVEGQSKANGGNVDGWSFNKGTNQKWEFTRNSDGTYSIVNGNSKLALSVSGSNVVQQSGNGAAQKWIVSYNHDGTFTLLSAANSSVALAVGTATPKSGDNAVTAPFAPTNPQRVRFEPTTIFTSGNAQLDNILEAMVARFGDNGRSSLQKVYDWVGNRNEFPYKDQNIRPAGSWQSWSVPYATEMYNNRTGNCYRYASLTCWFARRVGYDAKVISGSVLVSSGWAAHGWVELTEAGKTVIVDTEQHMVLWNAGRNFFMVDYDSAPLYYRY